MLRHQQTGAVAVFAAIAVGAGLVALALAVDVGRLYVAQRELQRMADTAALDAARVAGGCMGVPADPQAAAYGETLASVARNGGRAREVEPLAVVLGRDVLAADGRHYFAPAQTEETVHAVQVTLTRPAPQRVLPLGPPAGRLVARAAARSRPYASVHVGSRLVALDPEGLNPLLDRAFGGNGLHVSAVGYTSLFEASVPLDSLIDTLTPGAVDRLRFREETVPGLLRTMADTLAASGNEAAAMAAREIAASADRSQGIAPEEVISVQRESAQLVGSALIGAGQLTLLTAQATSESAAIEFLYTLPPPLGDSRALVRFIDPGRIALLAPLMPGETPRYASNTQGVLVAEVIPQSIALGGAMRLPVWVQVAQATAEVTDIQCARSDFPRDVVTVDARASVSRMGIGEFDDIEGPAPQPRPATLFDAPLAAGFLGIPVPVHVQVRAYAVADVPGDRRQLVFEGPFPSPPQTIGGPDTAAILQALALLPSQLDVQVQIVPVGAPGGPALGAVDASVRRFCEGAQQRLEAALRAQISELLIDAGDEIVVGALSRTGLTLGGADVRVTDVVAKEPYLFAR